LPASGAAKGHLLTFAVNLTSDSNIPWVGSLLAKTKGYLTFAVDLSSDTNTP